MSKECEKISKFSGEIEIDESCFYFASLLAASWKAANVVK